MKRIFSGIQPSGNLHLGNYLGAIQNWIKLQDEYDSIFCVVDLHAITVPQDPVKLRQKTIEVAKVYLAAGIDPEKCSIFIQSHVPEHTELTWILNTIAKNGDLARMIQFKLKTGLDFEEFEQVVRNQSERDMTDILKKEQIDLFKQLDIKKTLTTMHSVVINTAMDVYKKFIKERFNKAEVGIFDYPVLMASDILLYDTDLVPVGEDQIQHIELTKKLAERFNNDKRFGKTFKIPEPFIQKEGARIMGLDNPCDKMSKSAASEYNYIALTDDEEAVRRKIKKAVTDSGSEIVYSDDKPALKNLINIYSLLSEKSTKEIEKMYAGKGYADFKAGLAEVIIAFLTPFQERMKELSDEKVLEILKAGAEKVRPLAEKKLAEVKKKIGFIL
jgi:tryptophanyl-tRNA synthetase